ncbi:MAG: endonuclease domain-containing protein [Candidatus Margulisiibacteriota bacterium]
MRQIKKEFARQLRKEHRWEENKVWQYLRDSKFLKLKFRRQFVIEGFIVDFCCRELKLVIEIDGPIHLKQKEYDKERQNIIESKGYTFIRVTNKEVNQSIHKLFDRIRQLYDNIPLPLGEGRVRAKCSR